MAEIPPASELPEPALPAPMRASDLARSIADWTSEHRLITRYIKEHMREGSDYYTLTIRGQTTKPALSKSGSETFLKLFRLHASFRQDADTWEMLGRPGGVLCYVCTLMTASGEIVGEGRGARDVKKDGGDVNKAIKMACKSSQVDAILRTGALSDVFTQDLDEEREESQDARHSTPSASHRQTIVTLLRQLGMQSGSREAYEKAVLDRTGLTLMPDNYGAIIERLREAATQAA